MNQIILQPAGNKDAKKHYNDTIENSVNIREIIPFLNNKDINIINRLYSNSAPVWGVTPGSNLSNRNKWLRVKIGDVCLFAKDNYIFASGVVTHKVHNKNLALKLWNKDDSGSTWEYIYFLDEIKNHKIHYRTFNEVVGYAEKYVIRSFSVLDLEKSANVLDNFNLSSSIHIPAPKENEIDDIVKEMDEIDGKSSATTRKEQGYWRKKLFPKGTKKENCAICKKEFMINMLICAHIYLTTYLK